MRIAYVTETFPPELNGVALTVERAVRHLRERGHAVDLVRPRQPGDAAGEEPSEWLTAGWPIPQYPELRFGFATASALKRRLRQTEPHLVHLATPGPLAWNALRAARAMGIAASSDFRTNFHLYSGYYHLGAFESVIFRFLRNFHNRTERTFVPTRAVHAELAAAGFRNLSVVGRGVDTERFRPDRRSAELRARWGAHGDAPVLLSVGRVAAEKNIGLALRAFDALRRRDPAARMVVVGEGPLRKRLEAQHPEVHFAGVQRGEMLAACYASADIFVFPSLSETFGNVTLEALASGLPVVAYDTAAAGEHVAHRVSGLIVAPGDERAFESAVCSLALRPQRRLAMGEQAVLAAHQLRWDDVLGRFERHLQDTIDAHQTPSAAVAVVA
ncbi:MAG: glycosyltransferase family 1 protein [Pseudomonadota bacterium]|nr:glycosyltransferase family 1 protein [Pseudomonadota bacterium]